MTPQRWDQVKSLVAEGLEYPAEQRGAWLEGRKISDPAVAAEVRRLVQLAHDTDLLGATKSFIYAAGSTLLVHTAGEVLKDRFEILEFLGKGGMGEVYAALDRVLGEAVALKTLHSSFAQEPAAIARLKKEVRMAQRLQHPNLCRVHDIHRIVLSGGGETMALSMELLRGETLSQRIARGPLDWAEALPIVRQLVAGLEAAHAEGILHRDLKSGNVILVARPGDAVKAVITDFGLAREMISSPDTQSLDSLRAIVGTPAYMPPEQLRGEGVTAASDLYSLGVIVFEMVTGRLPFEGDSSLAIMLRRLKQEAPSPRQLAPGLPVRWDLVIRACLAPEPGERPPSPRALLGLLEGQGAGWYWLRRYRRRAILATFAVAACASLPVLIPPLTPVKHPAAAVTYYRRGEAFVQRRTAEEIQNAIDAFHKALTLDPKYAQAWASLADAYCAAAHYNFMDPKTAAAEAEKAAQAALSLDSHSAKAKGALAFVWSIDLKRWRQAGPLFQQATTLNDEEALPHAWYAAYLGRQGKFAEAITQARRAVDLDPASFYPNHQLSAEYFRAGRIQDFFQQAQELVRLQPGEPSSYLSLARADEWRGQYGEALKNCARAETLGSTTVARCYRGTIEAARGNRAEAQRIARDVDAYWREKPFESWLLANLYARLGEYDRAMDVLEQGYARGDGTVLAAPTSPYMEPMKSLPRFQAFVRKLGFDDIVLRKRS